MILLGHNQQGVLKTASTKKKNKMNGAFHTRIGPLRRCYHSLMVNWRSTLKATGTVYLPNEKAKSRLKRNEVVETDIGWLNLPQNLYGTLLRILRDGWWLSNLKIDQNSSVREPYTEGRQDEEREGVGELHGGELHQSVRRGNERCRLKWSEKLPGKCSGRLHVFATSRKPAREEGGN